MQIKHSLLARTIKLKKSIALFCIQNKAID